MPSASVSSSPHRPPTRSRRAAFPGSGYSSPPLQRPAAPALEAFRQRLRELGYHEGQTLAIEYRFAEAFDRLPALTADLVRLPADVLVAGSSPAIRAAAHATKTIPIVGIGVPTKLAAGLTGPGKNVTGVASGAEEFRKTWQALLQTAMPGVTRVAVLWDATNGPFRGRWAEVAARLVGIQLQPLEVRDAHEIERAFVAATTGRAEALLVPGSGLFYRERTRIAELAAQRRLPTVALFREFAEAGCLMAYGPNVDDMFRRAATAVDRLLKGAKPSELPVEPPARFELVINLKTAQALGLTLPPSVLVRADEVLP